MQENKTRPVHDSVEGFVDAIENERRRTDSRTLLAMMGSITGLEPVL